MIESSDVAHIPSVLGAGVVPSPETVRTLLMLLTGLALEEGFLDASSAFRTDQRLFGEFFDVGAKFIILCDA